MAHVDTSAAADTTYWYWARSFNGAGDNGLCSNAASGTTGAAPAISLTIERTYKVRGLKHADLAWSGTAGTHVDIYRDGARVATVPDSGAYTDNSGLKGGGTHGYQVCEAGSDSACSPVETAVY